MSFDNQNIIYLENEDFTQEGYLNKESLDTMKPVIIMIYGNGCPHCHHAMPEYIKLAQENPDLAIYTTIVTDGPDADSQLLSRLANFIPNLQGIPTFVLYRNGRYVKTFQGVRKAGAFKDFIVV